MRLSVWLILLLLLSCQAKPDTSTSSGNARKDTVTVQSQAQFPFPEIPATMTEPEARKAYLLTHYWEQFDFADTTLMNNRDVTEQGFVNFIALLLDGTTPEELTRESLANWCAGFVGKEHARQVLTQTADDYLFNPNSPFYNEGLYGMYLEALLGKLPQTDAMRSSYQFKLKLVKRNNPGNRATDFTYYLPDGRRRTLADTKVKGDRLLLMFYDPECESCHEVLLQMAADATLAEAVRTGKLSVLAIYTEGNDEAWRKTLADMPEGWTVGTDHEAIKTGALYDLKAMPSLYLLDGNKQVILKDAPYEQIHKTL
ncbi:DUF5106 domain-containing protein [Bacteroides caecigallinarum]|uniref:DUF5106 domain-containing protein n=1 Tax=Bacteroides caecigallinarum TaxID=1411144 RepID=UPI00195E459D|nr:DUF5106 domain-containing protein [Bacteroides caecigallinarum]MBM6890056.1 DUF5106 domain-containing protein [Bacteroides caecigallinarum]